MTLFKYLLHDDVMIVPPRGYGKVDSSKINIITNAIIPRTLRNRGTVTIFM